MKTSLLLLLTLAVLSCRDQKKAIAAPEAMPKQHSYPLLKEGSLEALDNSFWSIIPKEAKIEILAEGHQWTEGPLWLASKNMLLYSDIPKNAVFSWTEEEGSKLYLRPSGYLGKDFEGSEPGSNGLLLDKKGNLVLCQHGERRMVKMEGFIDDPQPIFTPIATRYGAARFNSPNDAVYKSNGDLYFTDPPYGLPALMENVEKELPYQGVFKVTNSGVVELLTNELTRPNGIAFSPDEKKMYLSNSDPEYAIWKVYDVGQDGLLKNGKIFFDATSMVPHEKGLPDGLKVDDEGNLFATGPGGVFLFSPEGKLLGKIRTGQATSNCSFNQDKSTLYITADSYVLRIKLSGT